MDLTHELKKLTEGFKANAPEQVQNEMQKAHDELVAKKIAATALKVNQAFPAFELKNQVHQRFSLIEAQNSQRFLRGTSQNLYDIYISHYSQ